MMDMSKLGGMGGGMLGDAGSPDEGASDTSPDTANGADIAELDAMIQKMQAILTRMKGKPGAAPTEAPAMGIPAIRGR